MAILKIARMGHPVLKRRSEPIADLSDPDVRRLVDDMLDTLEESGGTGLAAPQVHVSKRLIMFFVSGARAAREDAESATADADGKGADREGTDDVPLTVLLNPEIEPLSEETQLGWEACLSVPGLAGQVPRYAAIRYRGLDLRGREVVREARGFHARVVQHEFDHLDGILYPQRMQDLSTLTFTSEMNAANRAAAEE